MNHPWQLVFFWVCGFAAGAGSMGMILIGLGVVK